MFKFLFDKSERKAHELERVIIRMEAAALADDLLELHRLTRKQLHLLYWLQTHGRWSEERVMSFLKGRGRVRAFSDPQINELLSIKVPKAEMRYGLASTGIPL